MEQRKSLRGRWSYTARETQYRGTCSAKRPFKMKYNSRPRGEERSTPGVSRWRGVGEMERDATDERHRIRNTQRSTVSLRGVKERAHVRDRIDECKTTECVFDSVHGESNVDRLAQRGPPRDRYRDWNRLSNRFSNDRQ